jgi:hypothetical protein
LATHRRDNHDVSSSNGEQEQLDRGIVDIFSRLGFFWHARKPEKKIHIHCAQHMKEEFIMPSLAILERLRSRFGEGCPEATIIATVKTALLARSQGASSSSVGP